MGISKRKGGDIVVVIVVRSTCGGTAVGVSKWGHTVVVVHGTCGGWRLASGRRGAYRRHHPAPLVITPPVVVIIVVVLVQAVVCQWRMPKKKGGLPRPS